MTRPVPCPIVEDQPYVLTRPIRQTAPLVFASPHSGQDYPPALLRESRLDAAGLRRSEDSFVDELFGAAPGLGAPLLAATFPRAWCDPNREQWELDPGMFRDKLPGWVNTDSARVAAGLGTIPRVVASGEPIYRRKLRFAEAQARIRECWLPYHEALAGLVEQTKAAFGACLLIDCHSMPGSHHPDAADIVLGDVHGTACSPRVTAHVETWFRVRGYKVKRNDPYAGGYVTRHYGRPAERAHALQIEMSRALYMDEACRERLPGLGELAGDLHDLIASLADHGTILLR